MGFGSLRDGGRWPRPVPCHREHPRSEFLNEAETVANDDIRPPGTTEVLAWRQHPPVPLGSPIRVGHGLGAVKRLRPTPKRGLPDLFTFTSRRIQCFRVLLPDPGDDLRGGFTLTDRPRSQGFDRIDCAPDAPAKADTIQNGFQLGPSAKT